MQESAAWAGFAARHGAFHAAPSYTTDVDYSPLAAGQDVIVSGMGLAFVDLLVLLMEGRGGRFEELPGGGLRYVPSGAEPRLWAGSRRGVPYHSKITSALRGDAAGEPAFFTAEAVAALLDAPGELDFRAQLWPLIAKDAGYAYYRELFTGYPERVRIGWQEFAERFAAADWYSQERQRLVAESVPDAGLHLDLERLDHPFAGRVFAGHADFQSAVAAYIGRDLELRTGPDHSETLALFTSLLKSYMDLGRLVPSERLNARSQREVQGWWHGFFSFVDSGPPPRRLREMLAIHRAGLLQFIGPGLEIEAAEYSGRFVARSAQSGITVSAPALIEARLPAPSVARSANPLLRQLHTSGLGTEQQLLTADGTHATGRLLVSAHNELISPVGERRERLFGVGPGTSGWGAGAFARPGTNAAPFRENDALARRILNLLAKPNNGHGRQRPGQQRSSRRRPGGAAGRRRRKGPVMTPSPLHTPPVDTPPVDTRPVDTAALTVLNLPMSDPRVRPLLDELALEYDTRYGNLFGRGSRRGGTQPLPGRGIRRAGRGAADRARERRIRGRRRVPPARPADRRVQADLDAFGTPPPRTGPVCPGRAGGAGRPPRLPEGLPDHRPAPAGGETPLPEHRLRGTVRSLRRPGNHRAAGIHQGPARRNPAARRRR